MTNLTEQQILAMVDHTLLKQTATWDDIQKICDAGMKYQTASVCIPQCYVQKAKAYTGEKLAICTVIGFPNGNMTTDAKVFETTDAINKGADEIDMVINIGMLKAGEYDYILDEIKAIKKACGNTLLKVIIETCLLTEDEKLKMCEIVSLSGAEYIKTSTGFSTGGATLADVKLMSENVKNGVLVKAAGGIGNMEDAKNFIAAGANRLGTSRLIP